MSTVRLRRLQADYDKLRAFLAQQPRIRLIQAQGTPPERYQLEFQIKGLREVDEQLQTVANHLVEISLPLSYPRLPPQCRMLTPVFHPNIAPHAICIGDHWSAGEPLWSMVARIGEMIAYQSYNTKSPLNGEAARWVEANQHQLPLDRTNFIMDDPRPAASGGQAGHDPDDGYAVANMAPKPDPSIVPQPSRGADFSPPQETAMGPISPPMAVLPAMPPLRRQVIPPVQPPPSAPAPRSPLPALRPSAPNIVIECAQCRTRYAVPATTAGKKVRCKKCQAIMVIPLRRSLP